MCPIRSCSGRRRRGLRSRNWGWGIRDWSCPRHLTMRRRLTSSTPDVRSRNCGRSRRNWRGCSCWPRRAPGARRRLTPCLPAARELFTRAADEIRSARPSARSRQHHGHLLKAVAAIDHAFACGIGAPVYPPKLRRRRARRSRCRRRCGADAAQSGLRAVARSGRPASRLRVGRVQAGLLFHEAGSVEAKRSLKASGLTMRPRAYTRASWQVVVRVSDGWGR